MRGRSKVVIALATAALVAGAGGAALILRPSLPAGPRGAPNAGPPTSAREQLAARQRAELELVGRLGDELDLTAVERAAVEAALEKLQAGRQAQLTRLMDGSAGQEEITTGLLAHHRSFEEDLGKALGAKRATELNARFDEAYDGTSTRN